MNYLLCGTAIAGGSYLLVEAFTKNTDHYYDSKSGLLKKMVKELSEGLPEDTDYIIDQHPFYKNVIHVLFPLCKNEKDNELYKKVIGVNEFKGVPKGFATDLLCKPVEEDKKTIYTVAVLEPECKSFAERMFNRCNHFQLRNYSERISDIRIYNSRPMGNENFGEVTRDELRDLLQDSNSLRKLFYNLEPLNNEDDTK